MISQRRIRIIHPTRKFAVDRNQSRRLMPVETCAFVQNLILMKRNVEARLGLFPFALAFGFAVVNSDQHVARLAVQCPADFVKDSKLNSIGRFRALDSREGLVLNACFLSEPVTGAATSFEKFLQPHLYHAALIINAAIERSTAGARAGRGSSRARKSKKRDRASAASFVSDAICSNCRFPN